MSVLSDSGGAGRSAVYGGGPFYSGGRAEIDVVRASGFTTVVLWCVHVHPDGDLSFSDTKIISKGEYVGPNTRWAEDMRALKQAPTSVERIEVSVGSADVRDWENIRDLLKQSGTREVLRKNFAKLQEITGADAVNDDDESCYDADATVEFARLAHEIGYRHFTLAPYTRADHWKAVKDRLGSLVDRVYLQVYDGGSANNPKAWTKTLGMPVDPGLWCRHGSACGQGDSPSDMKTKLNAWRISAKISGGFVWLYDDIIKCSAASRTAKDYAQAVNAATRPQ